jgi:hypothetical protein
MASLVFLRRPLIVGLGLTATFSSYQLFRQHRRPLLCESSNSKPIFSSYSSEAKVPIVKDGKLNPYSFRQISSGSILGRLCRASTKSTTPNTDHRFTRRRCSVYLFKVIGSPYWPDGTWITGIFALSFLVAEGILTTSSIWLQKDTTSFQPRVCKSTSQV